MAFKMKRTDMLKKGGLSGFFSSLGKQLKRNRRDIGGEFKGVKQKDKPGGFGSLTDKDKDGMSDFIQAQKKLQKEKKQYLQRLSQLQRQLNQRLKKLSLQLEKLERKLLAGTVSLTLQS